MAKTGRALLDRLTADALGCVRAALDDAVRARAAPPEAVALVVRQYAATGREDLRDAAGAALAHAVEDAAGAPDADDRSAWLLVLAEALALSDDERLRTSVETLAEACAATWPSSGAVGVVLRNINAAIAAASSMPAPPAPPAATLMSRAIDEMERIVAHAYSPGAGLVHELGAASERGGVPRAGSLDDHATAASTLLRAFVATARLPYAMLADELMQCAQRRWWDAGDGWRAPFAEACAACRAMCRLAALYRDRDYREAAVLGTIDYASDAEHALDVLEPGAGAHRDSALYGLAVFELLAIQSAI